MNITGKLLLSVIGALFAATGTVAIVTEVHTASTRRSGIVTLLGDDAVFVGQTCLVLAVLPLLVWLPSRWVAPAIVTWWVGLMAWIFVSIFRF